VAVHTAISKQIKELSGLIVLDVVEGTAMASLNYMDMYLAKVPSSFPTLEKAIQWTYVVPALRTLHARTLLCLTSSPLLRQAAFEAGP
jgi:protein phosphatase methylesterase 1